MNNIACALGLIFDIIGTWFIYKYGLPNINDAGSGGFLVTENYDRKAKELQDRYFEAFALLGIRLIALGFLLQLSVYAIGIFTQYVVGKHV